MIEDQFKGLTRAREAGIDAGVGGYRKAENLRQRLDSLQVEDAAREFEQLFASMLIKEMRATLNEGLFGKGAGSDTYGAWFDQHVGRSLADSGAFDLAGMLRAGLPQGEVIPAADLKPTSTSEDEA